VAGQRARATSELLRLRRVHGRDTAQRFELRYGSLGFDPPGWAQAGPHATRVPNSSPSGIARFEAARASGRIALGGAAEPEEVARGLIDDRLLRLLAVLAETHRLQITSLRLSHPRTVQDELGTPTDSNHIYGRAADISAVDGVPCKRETAGAPYRTLVDNPPPSPPGPCLTLAYEAASLTTVVAPEEVIFYWRVPGPTGSSLPNHDDHVHLGFRSFPATATATPDPAEALRMPSTRPSHTLKVRPRPRGSGTSAD
jgi:hypothetical protein